MTNRELIREFIRGEREYNACNHLGYKQDTLYNYSTIIARIDRWRETCQVNARKYSTTTSKIQTMLRSELAHAGFAIEEYDGEGAFMWNYGYMGAPVLKRSDFRPE